MKLDFTTRVRRDHSELKCSEQNKFSAVQLTVCSLSSEQCRVEWEITRTLDWAKTVALRVDPGNDGDKVRDVGGENTGEEDVIAPDNIHFEHVSIKLLLNDWKIGVFLHFSWKLLVVNIIFNTASVKSLLLWHILNTIKLRHHRVGLRVDPSIHIHEIRYKAWNAALK